MAPLPLGAIRGCNQAKGENIGGVIRFLVVHQSEQAQGNQRRRATQDNLDYKLHCNCHNQRRRVESNPYVPWTGGNHRVSRVGWDEESGDDEGGHLHQGPHLILSA